MQGCGGAPDPGMTLPNKTVHCPLKFLEKFSLTCPDGEHKPDHAPEKQGISHYNSGLQHQVALVDFAILPSSFGMIVDSM